MNPQTADDEPNEFAALDTLDLIAAFLFQKYGEEGDQRRGSGSGRAALKAGNRVRCVRPGTCGQAKECFQIFLSPSGPASGILKFKVSQISQKPKRDPSSSSFRLVVC